MKGIKDMAKLVYGIFADGESAQTALKKFECCDTFAGAYRTAAKGVEMIK